MSDTLPKNVEAFIEKYGRRGSREQDAAFWKDFRKAANAYADTQAYRLQELDQRVAEYAEDKSRLATMVLDFREQRDRLAEAVRRIAKHSHSNYDTSLRNAIEDAQRLLPENQQALAAVTMPDCPRCGNNRQVWVNQISGKLKCHRVGCERTEALAAVKGKTCPDHVCALCYHDKADASHCNRPDCEEKSLAAVKQPERQSEHTPIGVAAPQLVRSSLDAASFASFMSSCLTMLLEHGISPLHEVEALQIWEELTAALILAGKIPPLENWDGEFGIQGRIEAELRDLRERFLRRWGHHQGAPHVCQENVSNLNNQTRQRAELDPQGRLLDQLGYE